MEGERLSYQSSGSTFYRYLWRGDDKQRNLDDRKEKKDRQGFCSCHAGRATTGLTPTMAGMGFFSPSTTDQIVAEFFVKCLHIILEARIPAPSSQLGRDSPAQASSSSRDRWFNLVLESAEPWRRNPCDPMVVDILLARSSGDARLRGSSPDSCSEGEDADASSGTVLERWIFQLLPTSNFLRA